MKLVKVIGAALMLSAAGCAVSSEAVQGAEHEEISAAASAISSDEVDSVPAYFNYDNHFATDDDVSWIYASFNSHVGKRITVDLHTLPEAMYDAVGFNLYKVAQDGSLRFSRTVYGYSGEAVVTFTSKGTGSYVLEMVSSGNLSDVELNLSCNDGNCSPDVQPGGDCGGFAGLRCAEGLYCAHAADMGCGVADGSGICAVTATACIETYNPVCGCDGQTYGNSCIAESAGIAVKSGGECAVAPKGSQVGESCGGFRRGTVACAEGLYCNYEPGDVCGWADAAGSCAEKPVMCSQLFEPVCGCDQTTYGNACIAASKGVAVYQSGECASEPEQ